MSKKLAESVYKSSELIELLGKRGLQQALENEEIFHLSKRGYYVTPKMPLDDKAFLYAASKFHPEAIVSKDSALFYYGLSEHLSEKLI